MTAITADVKAPQATFVDNTKGRTLMNPFQAPGPVRATYFYYKNETGGTLPANTVIDFGPILRTGYYLPIVLLKTTAQGTGRTMDFGFQEHLNRDSGATVDAEIDAILDGVDTSAALNATVNPMVDGLLLVTGDAVRLLGKVLGGTLPNNAVISGYLLSMNPF